MLHLVLRLRGMISSFTSSTESYLTWKIIVKSGSIAAPLTNENNVVTQASGGFAGTLTANLDPASTTVTVKSAVGQRRVKDQRQPTLHHKRAARNSA